MGGTDRWTRAFEALTHPCRRELLFTLQRRTADGEAAFDPEELLIRTRTDESVVLALRHQHLPKLQAMGYVEWDSEEGTVRQGDNWAELNPLLRELRSLYDPPLEEQD
jgi:hypothetical protein